jgi:2'-5' RNA ligase
MALFGIYAGFDPKAKTILASFRQKLAEAIKGLPDPTKKMEPHITLLIFSNPNRQEVISHFEKCDFSNLNSFSLELTKAGSFKGQNVAYIEPDDNKSLKTLQKYIYDMFSGFEITQMSIPKLWKPHVTFTKGISDELLDDSIKYLSSSWTKIIAKIEKIALIDVRYPLDVLSFKVLSR